MTLAWDALNELDAYRITEIPRRPEPDATQPSRDEPDDVGRTQRLAALIAAYHAGADANGNGSGALAIGWVRHTAGGPVQVLAAGAGLVGSDVGQDVFLTLPGGARAQPLLRGTLATLMTQLPSWRAIGGISDGLLPDDEHRAGRRPPPSLEECLLAVWPGPFGWLLIAEPLSAGEIQEIADGLAEREHLSAGYSDRFPERAMEARRLSLRHAEMRKGASAGVWRVRLLGGGADADAASRVAGLVCASADLADLPYAVAPAGSAPGSLQEALDDPTSGRGRRRRGGSPPVLREHRADRRAVPAARTRDAGHPAGAAARFRRHPGASGRPGDDRRRRDPGPEPPAAGPLVLPLDSLNRHVFVSGATGSGKSQTVRTLLEAATRAGIPWLVVEPAKAEYRLMAARLAGFGPAEAVGPGGDAVVSEVVRIRPGESDAIAAGLNPLEPAPDEDGRRFPLQTHANLVKALFLASFRSDEPFPQVLSAALTRVYEEAGWDLALGETVAADADPGYPNLTDLQRAAIRIVQEVGYSQRITDDVLGFIKVRLSSLRLGTTGRFLEGGHQLDFGKLLSTNAVLEIEDVGDDSDKAFLMGTVLIRLAEHLRMANRAKPSGPGRRVAAGGTRGRPRGRRAPATLRHLTVIEEAHRLLRRPETGAPGGAAAHAVEMFAGLLAEIRAYGEGLIIAEQIPDRLIQDVIKNTAVKITHRLPAADDREAVGATMNMTQAQNRFLVTLKPGEAAVFADGMDFPLLAQMPDGTSREAAADAATAAPAGVVRPRSITCGADCAGRPCTLRDMRVAQRALDEYPAIRLWTELSVVAHLTGWPMPVPRTALLSLLQMMPSRLRDCAISHGVDAAVNVRVPVIAGRVSPVGLASHVSTAIRSRISRGSWLCQREEPKWLAPAYKWTLVLDALKSADRKTPGPARIPGARNGSGATGRRLPATPVRARWERCSAGTTVHSGTAGRCGPWRSAWTASPASSGLSAPARKTTTSRSA